jgi:peptidoglycan/xylan/chitin deacetylase (PgdA/CDA1 family)
MNILNSNIPVVMFHSLKYSHNDLFYLSWDSAAFVELVRKLLKKGFEFVTIENIVNKEIKTSKPQICFTFDDGFGDNYTVLFEVAKYFEIKFTIFLSTDFIHEHRNNPFESSKIRNFLSKKEIIEMSNSGLIDFQGHSQTHTWYPASGEIKYICELKDITEQLWIYWNRYPEKKGFVSHDIIHEDLQKLQDKFVVFENKRALAVRRFYPEMDEFSISDPVIGSLVNGRFETKEEQIFRYEQELIGSKKYLENLLNKEITFLCWPGGEMDELAYQVFKRAGYKACSMPSNSEKIKNAKNIFDQKQNVIVRTSPVITVKKVEMDCNFLVDRFNLFTKTGTKKTLRSTLMTAKYYINGLVRR